MSTDDVLPLQTNTGRYDRGAIPRAVHMRAYEVYEHLHGSQIALITGGCRGGFGVGEVIAFLYAYPFPKAEWRHRVDEALRGLKT